MPETGWTQPDTIRTREPFMLRAGVNANVTHHHGAVSDPHSGPIEYDPHYLAVVYDPALDTTLEFDGTSPEADQRASSVHNKRWLETPVVEGVDLENYEALLNVSGSGSTVHDFDPFREWLSAFELDALSDFDAAPPEPGITFRVLEWEVNPFLGPQWGTHENRRIEVDLSLLANAKFDRDGDPITPTTTVLDHGILAIPPAFVPEATYFYNYNETFSAWEGFLTDISFGHTWLDAMADFEVLHGPFNAGTTGADISDATWAALASPIQTFGGYHSLGLPLILGPAFATIPATPDPLGFEVDDILTTTADIWFESDWTPPRYKIVYSVTETRPALRLYRRDGDGRGLGGVTRMYPPPRGRRLYPPHA